MLKENDKVKIVKDKLYGNDSKLIGKTGYILKFVKNLYHVQIDGFGKQLKPLFESDELESV